MYKNGLFQGTKEQRPSIEQVGEVYINAYIEGENTPMQERREAGKEAAYTKWPWLRPMIAASGPMSKSRGGYSVEEIAYAQDVVRQWGKLANQYIREFDLKPNKEVEELTNKRPDGYMDPLIEWLTNNDDITAEAVTFHLHMAQLDKRVFYNAIKTLRNDGWEIEARYSDGWHVVKRPNDAKQAEIKDIQAQLEALQKRLAELA